MNKGTVELGASRSVAWPLTLLLCPLSTPFWCRLKLVTVSYISMESKLETATAQLCVLVREKLIFSVIVEVNFHRYVKPFIACLNNNNGIVFYRLYSCSLKDVWERGCG